MASKQKTAPARASDTPQEMGGIAGQRGLPLFFQKPAALEKHRHAKAGLITKPSLAFAGKANSVSLTALEFIEAAKHYPIVFSTAEDATPMAILGLESENYFVTAEGEWTAGAYVPAYVRQYPFILFENAEEKRFFLCVDEKASQFRVEGGEGAVPFFNDDGTPSPLSNQALEFCHSFYQHHGVTRNFVADLKQHNLLVPYQSSVTLKSGRKIVLSGFSMIDEAAFNALSEQVFLEFRTKGWLPFIYLSMASASNWKQLYALAESRESKH